MDKQIKAEITNPADIINAYLDNTLWNNETRLREKKIKEYTEKCVGKVYNKLLCKKISHWVVDDNNTVVAQFICDCGKTKYINLQDVISGNSRSCGCLRKIELRRQWRRAGGFCSNKEEAEATKGLTNLQKNQLLGRSRLDNKKLEKITRTEQLKIKLKRIKYIQEDAIKKLSYNGPRGGHNAKFIEGWSKSTNNITRAGVLPMMKWWDGSAPTPSTGIPTCCRLQAMNAEEEIFGKSHH